MRTPLKLLIETLPAADSPYVVDEHRAISTGACPVPSYVWPDVQLDQESLTDSPVVLVSAPGAMGKSQAALAIAKELDAVYVDLAKINVGSGTLVGELYKALGATGLEAFQRDVRAGRASLGRV